MIDANWPLNSKRMPSLAAVVTPTPMPSKAENTNGREQRRRRKNNTVFLASLA